MQTQSTSDDHSGSGSDGWKMILREARQGLLWRLARARAVGIQMGPLIGAGIGMIVWGAALIAAGVWMLP